MTEDGQSPLGARGTETFAPGTSPVAGTDRLRWTAFRYRLPRCPSGVRSAVWRELTDLEALNLNYGVWALPFGRDEDRLAALFERVLTAGGEATASVVGNATMADVELQSRLTRACESLWDGFSIAADWFGTQLALGSKSADDQVHELDQLRAQFGPVLMRDVIGSEAAGRAGTRLDRFAAEILGGEDVDRRPADERLTRRRVEVGATWVLESGALRAAAQVVPLPGIRWERAFEEFEALLYQPSGRRVPIRHGAFTWTSTPDALPQSLESLENRVAQFGRYLG